MAATRIDCDIHPGVGGTRTTLLPYLNDHWKEQVVSRAIDGLDLNSYPPAMPFSGRPDWRPTMASPAASLRWCSAARSTLGSSMPSATCSTAPRRCTIPNGGRLLQRHQRLDRGRMAGRDPRLRASIVVPMQAPDLAVEEIERRAATTASSRCWCWRRARAARQAAYWPVWQVAEKHKLPIAIHAGSAYRSAPSSIGWPSYRYEYYLAEAQAFQAQILQPDL